LKKLAKISRQHPCFYGNVINKAIKLKSDTRKMLEIFFIHKGYDLATIVDSKR